MSLLTLVPRVIYGHRTDVKNNAHYITDSEIMYASGAALVFQNIITNSQKYLILPEKARFLRRLSISPQRNYVAALVSTGDLTQIHIFEASTLKRKRSLTLPPDATTKTFESLSFSYDERFVMVITGHPDWMMLAFHWERGKVETSTRANLLTNPLAPVREVLCSPTDTSTLVIYGQGIFRLMNMQETVWRQYGFQKADNFDITSCCFLTGDRLLCGTDDGLLFLIELGELKFIFEATVVNYIHAKADKEEEILGVIPSSMLLERTKGLEEEEVKQERAIRALTPLNTGFAYACGTVVYFFEKISPHKYKKRNEYEITDKDFRENQTVNIHVVMHLTVNKSETTMIAVTRRSQLYVVKLWGPEIDIARRVPFTHQWLSFHNGRIGDLALCQWKPIFMTCGSQDRTVRVWNYLTNALEMVKQYQEDIHSVSLHPTGLYAAIGFSDKLRFMVVLIDDLQVTRELPIRECLKSAFNLSGHLLAAVNRNIIQIYNVITFQNVANLKGHSGSRSLVSYNEALLRFHPLLDVHEITCLQWTQDDKKLVSCGMDGTIYEWDMNTFKRVGEIVHKGVIYWECAVMSNGKNIYAVGSDNYLKEFRSSNVLRTLNLQTKNMTHVVVSRSNAFMFIASSEGWLINLKMPIEEPPEYELVHIHAWKVEQIKLTLDDRILITCSEAGTICVWNLENIEGKEVVLDKDFQYFKEILISKTDLEEKLATVKDLTQRTFELEMEHAYQMRHIRTLYDEKINDIHGTYQHAIEELKGTFEILEANHNTELNDISSDINIMKERHEAEMLELEAKYNAELIVEYEKVLSLEKLKETLIQDYETKLEALQMSKAKTIEEVTRINESKIYNLNKMVEEAREEICKEVAEHTELTNQIEDENDREVESLKLQCDKTIKAARESNMRLKGETGVLKKKILSCEKERDLAQMEIIAVTGDNEKLKLSIQNLEQEILDLKKEVGERDLRIQDKEKRIYDLKRKDQEYERYKFVLNKRIKELKNQIEPMDKEIKERKEHIAEMEVELYELQKINLSLDNNLSNMREKLGNAYKLLHVHKNKNTAIMQVIRNVKRDIFSASGNTQDFKKLKDGVKKLYFKYITDKEFAKSRKGDEECIAELRRQKAYLEEIVHSMENDVEKNKHVRYGEAMLYMDMNWTLMEEISKIRKKLRTAQRKVQDLETLVCVRLTKDYSPRQAHKMVQKALRSVDDLKEECAIKMEEATTKATLMREEVDSLLQRILEIENSLIARASTQKKKRRMEPLHFDIPSII